MRRSRHYRMSACSRTPYPLWAFPEFTVKVVRLERLVYFAGNDVILHRHRNPANTFVFGLGFHIQSKLLNAQIDAPGDLIEPGQLEINARAGHSLELAHALHHHGLSSSYLKKTTQDRPSAKMPTIAAMTNPGMVSIRILPESGSFVLERIHAPQEQARESQASWRFQPASHSDRLESAFGQTPAM